MVMRRRLFSGGRRRRGRRATAVEEEEYVTAARAKRSQTVVRRVAAAVEKVRAAEGVLNIPNNKEWAVYRGLFNHTDHQNPAQASARERVESNSEQWYYITTPNCPASAGGHENMAWRTRTRRTGQALREPARKGKRHAVPPYRTAA